MLIPQHLAALALGYALDLVVGDPHNIPHPVRWMGRLICALEPPLRAAFPKTDRGELAAGAVLAALVPLVSWAVAAAVVVLASRVSPWLGLAVETVICCQMLATKSLRVESMRVHDALDAGDLPAARRAVSMIVGRDTQSLDAAGVTRAAVETVAENASDGVVAPLLYMALGGAPLGVLYKAVNTMDSMVGYKNDRYRHFGTCAARMDDVLNFVPARVSGALMCAGAALAGFDGRGAWRIMRRDHAKHLSPNSAYTEAACAGALGVRLAGDNYYFGKLVHKPTLGDATRPVEPADIARANRLLYATSLLGFALSLAMGWALGTLVEVPLWL
jgi:adenosylcobinamide-phosphate synthase